MAYGYTLKIYTTFSGSTGVAPYTTDPEDLTAFEYLYMIATGTSVANANSVLSGENRSSKCLCCPGKSTGEILITSNTYNVSVAVAVIRPGCAYQFSSGSQISSSSNENILYAKCYVPPRYTGDVGNPYLTETFQYITHAKEYPYFMKSLCSNWQAATFQDPATWDSSYPINYRYTNSYVKASELNGKFGVIAGDGRPVYGGNRYFSRKKICFVNDGSFKWNSDDALVRPHGYTITFPDYSCPIYISNQTSNELTVEVQMWMMFYGETSETQVAETGGYISAGPWSQGYGNLSFGSAGTYFPNVTDLGISVKSYGTYQGSWSTSINGMYFSGMMADFIYWQVVPGTTSISTIQITIS